MELRSRLEGLRKGFAAITIVIVTIAIGGGCGGGAAGGPTIGTTVPAEDASTPTSDAAAPSDAGAPPDATVAVPDAGTTEVAPAPVVTSIAPPSAVVGSVGPTIVVTGSGFVARSIVQVDGAPLATTLIAPTELRAAIPTSKLKTVGTLHVSVGTSPPGGGASAEVTFAVVNPAPVLTSLAPTSALVGAPATSLVVTGSSFVSGATILFDGQPLTTTFGSATSLSATVAAAALLQPGSFDVRVTNPAPGGGTSNPIAFTVANATAVIASVAPSDVVVGAGDTSIELVGAGFLPGSVLSFNGAPIATSVTSGQAMTGTIPSASLAQAGAYPIVVVNPPPGGGTSTPFLFEVRNPPPGLASIAPTSAPVGSSSVVVNVTGDHFTSASQVSFDGAPAVTTFDDAAHLEATLDASDLTTAKSILVRVVTPGPGGGTSAAVAFAVTNPSPSLSSVTPSSVLVGAPDTTITVKGGAFVPASFVVANGANLATTYVDGATLTAKVPAAMLASATTYAIDVVTPGPGGGSSSTASFVVSNAAPKVDALTPAQAIVGAADTMVTIDGAGFVLGSTARANSAALATTYVNAGRVLATIPAARLATKGSLAIDVVNPNALNGTSNALSFAVVDCDTTGVDLVIVPGASPTTLPLPFTGAPTASRITTTGTSTCPATADTSSAQPYRAWVVQNKSPAAATLSAWAVCDASKDEDAFLTFYRRATVPGSDAERTQCTPVIAEGGSYASPSAGGSSYCPGLTAANGGAISLGACEKAVVFVQPWTVTSTVYPPPPTLTIQLQ